MMYFTENPITDAERYAQEGTSQRYQYKRCCVCGERILPDEQYYDFDGDTVCRECMSDYVFDRYLVTGYIPEKEDA